MTSPHHGPPPALTELAHKQRMTPVERAKARPNSLKMAIWAKCFECQDCGAGKPHLTKANVRDCAAVQCALWPHRGWQSTTTRKS